MRSKGKFLLLVTGSRVLGNREVAEDQARKLLAQKARLYGPENIDVIHGDAQGWDNVFKTVVKAWGGGMAEFGYPAEWFDTPLLRNDHMVSLLSKYQHLPTVDAVEVWAFASSWASSTGNCARTARRAGLTVIDYGVNTEMAHRPKE